MKIAVCVKEVPDATAPKRLDPGTKRLDRSGEKTMNPYDAHALEEAVRLKEGAAGADSLITALCMGPEGALRTLHKALSLGADEALLVSDPALEGADIATTARVLAAAALKTRRAATQLQTFIARYRSRLPPQTPMPIEAPYAPVIATPVAPPTVPDDHALPVVAVGDAAPAPAVALVPEDATILPVVLAAAEPEPAAAPQKRKKKAARKRTPRKSKLPPPAEVIAIDRKPAAKDVASKTAGTRKRRTTPRTRAEIKPPVPPERLH